MRNTIPILVKGAQDITLAITGRVQSGGERFAS
jgi:hypothetical protein